jgi:hypothetical protein
MTGLGAHRVLGTIMGAPEMSLGAPRITLEQSEKTNISFGNAAGATGNYSYYLLFNNF